MKNLTNPDKTPVDGDWVEDDIPGGGTIKYYFLSPSEATDETKKAGARAWRNFELEKTDFISMISDHPQNAAYKTYRQKLRDWPSTSDFPDTKPELGS